MTPCLRCGGLRVREYEREESQGLMMRYARCVNCGGCTELVVETVQVVRDEEPRRHLIAHWRNDGTRAIP